MPFSPDDFLKLAEQLYKDEKYYSINEARLRTSISRAYYSVFLIIREIIRRKLLNTWLEVYFDEVARSGLIHACIKAIIGKFNRPMEKMYGRLFVMRKTSDYDLKTNISRKDAEEAIGIARRLLELSKLLDNTFDLNRIARIIMDYYSRYSMQRK